MPRPDFHRLDTQPYGLQQKRPVILGRELKAGETLRGREGSLQVVSVVRHPGTDRVYNMTVEDEHVYYVSGIDLLAHNADDCRQKEKTRPPAPNLPPSYDPNTPGIEGIPYSPNQQDTRSRQWHQYYGQGTLVKAVGNQMMLRRRHLTRTEATTVANGEANAT